MRRLFPHLGALLLLLPLVGTAPARGQDSLMTVARQLDLATQHLATTAIQEAKAGRLDEGQARVVDDFAALARGFRFELEGSYLSSLQAQVAWEEVSDAFVAARRVVGKDGDRDLQHEVLRVHSLMNRLDRAFGGTGFWQGKQGWNG